MEKIKNVIEKNKAISAVVLVVVIVLAGFLVKRQFKKAAPKTAKTQQVKTNADGTPKTKKTKKADAPASADTTTQAPAATDSSADAQ